MSILSCGGAALFSRQSIGRLAFLLPAALIGCGQPHDMHETYPVSGQLTLDGAAVAGVLVELHPVEGTPAAVRDLRPSGKTDESGSFQISTYQPDDGAPAGEYTVTFIWMGPDPQDAADAQPQYGGLPQIDLLDSKYADPATSTIKVTIDDQANTLEPFSLMR